MVNERRLGHPRTDVERVARHYNISLEEADRWLSIHPVEMLLEARGAGLIRGTAAGMRINSIERLLQGVRGLESFGVAALPGEKLTVMVGDTVRVRVTVDYRGPTIDGAIWVAIGRQDTWFNEDFASRTEVTFPSSMDWANYEYTCDVPITDRPGTNYDMYAKIMEVPGPDIFAPTLLNVIDVIGVAEFRNFKIASYDKV